MMLNSEVKEFIETLERYLVGTLHEKIRIKEFDCPPTIPIFLRSMYNLYETWIAGIRCIIMAGKNGIATPAQVAKHVDLMHSLAGAIIIFAAPSLSGYNRSRLIAQRVAFVVPGNQLYIPELAADLREYFRAMKEKAADSLSPAAQAVLFHYILRIDEHAVTSSAIARNLRYSAMSIGRAFDDLITCGLAHVKKYGKERRICFNPNRRILFEKSLLFLRSPVRSTKYIQNGFAHSLKLAGESALSQLTDISPPQRKVFAVVASQWRARSQEDNLLEVKETIADFSVETWSYDPEGLSLASTVDPLSLYVHFRDHRDERLAIAAESLLEGIMW